MRNNVVSIKTTSPCFRPNMRTLGAVKKQLWANFGGRDVVPSAYPYAGTEAEQCALLLCDLLLNVKDDNLPQGLSELLNVYAHRMDLGDFFKVILSHPLIFDCIRTRLATLDKELVFALFAVAEGYFPEDSAVMSLLAVLAKNKILD